MASGRTCSSNRRTPAWSRRSASTRRTRSTMPVMVSRGLRHRTVPTTSTAARERQYSARWLPAMPVMPVISTRMVPFQHTALPEPLTQVSELYRPRPISWEVLRMDGDGGDVDGESPRSPRPVADSHASEVAEEFRLGHRVLEKHPAGGGAAADVPPVGDMPFGLQPAGDDTLPALEGEPVGDPVVGKHGVDVLGLERGDERGHRPGDELARGGPRISSRHAPDARERGRDEEGEQQGNRPPGPGRSSQRQSDQGHEAEEVAPLGGEAADGP